MTTHRLFPPSAARQFGLRAALLLIVAAMPRLVDAQVVRDTSAASRDSLRSSERDSLRDRARIRALERARAIRIAPISIAVTRETARSPFALPFATMRITPDATRPGLRRTTIGELLLGVPGVIVQERANPSQDPRIAVRGFGARAAFGVRGVRVLRDGVPLSLPDGQTPVDWLDLETVGAINVVRGTAAALYGNAAGGVVDFTSRMPDASHAAVTTRANVGAGVVRSNVTASGRARTGGRDGGEVGSDIVGDAGWRDAGWLASATGTHGDGVREWSRIDATSLFARTFATVAGTRVEVQGTRYDANRAENTGALTAAELARDPTLPDSLNITKRSRKAAQQSQVAVIASRTNGANELAASAFVSTRQLDNPLAFAIVAVDRHVGGATLRGTRRFVWRAAGTAASPGTPRADAGGVPFALRLSAGGDAQRQNDSRFNFENCADVLPTAAPTARCPVLGIERGAVRLDQGELVTAVGGYARVESEIGARLLLSAAVRRDVVAFHLRDRFITAANLDDSGDRRLSATTPMFGAVWRVRPTISVYGNATRAFETPTITELTNQADGSAGLNGALDPQRTQTIEVGTQAIVASRVRLDLAAFRARVRGELVSFDVPNAPGRRAFRNAGRSSRDGVEVSIATSAGPLQSGVAYTYSRFRFDEYTVGTTSYAQQRIPGIPEQQMQWYLTARGRGAFVTVDMTAASRSSANDAATVFAAGYATWSLRGGYDGVIARGHFTFAPTAGVDNVFDRHYAPSVVVNATRGRYFEPGAPRRAFVGVRVGAR